MGLMSSVEWWEILKGYLSARVNSLKEIGYYLGEPTRGSAQELLMKALDEDWQILKVMEKLEKGEILVA